MIIWQILVVGSSVAAELSSFVAAIVGVHAPADVRRLHGCVAPGAMQSIEVLSPT